MSSEPAEVWLTTEDVAKLARTSTSNVHYLRSVGKGPKAAKLGRRLLFDRSEVEAWLRNMPAAATRSDRDPAA